MAKRLKLKRSFGYENEEKIKSLFSDVRMRKLKDIMMEKIQTEEKSEIED